MQEVLNIKQFALRSKKKKLHLNYTLRLCVYFRFRSRKYSASTGRRFYIVMGRTLNKNCNNGGAGPTDTYLVSENKYTLRPVTLNYTMKYSPRFQSPWNNIRGKIVCMMLLHTPGLISQISETVNEINAQKIRIIIFKTPDDPVLVFSPHTHTSTQNMQINNAHRNYYNRIKTVFHKFSEIKIATCATPKFASLFKCTLLFEAGS
jgi:hypothetical protein